MTRGAILYFASFAAHGALAVGIVSLKGARVHEDVAISVVETKKAETPPAETPPPPPPPEPTAKAAPAKAKAAIAKAIEPEAAPPSAAPSEASSVPDFGLSLGGGSGGLAVASHAAAPPASATAERVTKRVLAAPPPVADACSEAIKKPKVVSINQPAYTPEARDAQVAGKVRVEVTVDGAGKVASARVLEGLGHGLDEAALSAARGASFEPGTKCGKPTTTTFVIAIRFAL